jgi:hypothetical protein
MLVFSFCGFCFFSQRFGFAIFTKLKIMSTQTQDSNLRTLSHRWPLELVARPSGLATSIPGVRRGRGSFDGYRQIAKSHQLSNFPKSPGLLNLRLRLLLLLHSHHLRLLRGREDVLVARDAGVERVEGLAGEGP